MKSNGKVERLETGRNKLSPGGIMIKEKATILVIDNSRDFTQAVKGALERTGRYVVAQENDSRKAHQICHSHTGVHVFNRLSGAEPERCDYST